MEESAEYLKIRSSALSVGEAFLDYDGAKTEHVEVDGLLDDGITAQEKNKKKKKKHKGGLSSPRRILAFNTSELSKLDELKAVEKCAKSFSKSASFPSNAIPKDTVRLVEGSGDFKDSKDYAILSFPVEKILVRARATSFHVQLKSALRGGHQELGIGPRPKLQVKWASSVWEPPCSTVSHTVIKSRCKDPKQGKKGKSSHEYPHKRHDKKKHQKSKGGSNNVRRHGTYCIDGSKEATNPLQADILNRGETGGSARALPELESKDTDASEESDDLQDVGLSFSLETDAVGLAHTCGGSLFEPERLACNFLNRQAM